jgi:guanylate kinase
LRDAGGFLEWFDVYGDLKGTLRSQVLDALAEGRDVLVEVDVKGALAIKEAFPGAVLVFIRAPSRDEQIRRLTERATDSPEALARRLSEAAAEEALASHFDHIVVNDDVDQAVRALADILDAHTTKPGD